ncbi:MAG: hypothetical protein LUG23_07655 [Oscillospiraceae bacterium]|nr:hypothetical protein [Oscillospiraceae bacterium]MCD7889770.1 hypothetical protein [Oscillospiraceae bacterium]
MSYVVAKRWDKIGSIAIEMELGSHLVEFKRRIRSVIDEREIELFTISRPSAYGEYEPYRFVDSESEFEEQVKLL